MSIGISILAYDDQHIKECMIIVFLMKDHDVKFYITTNKPDLITKGNNIIIIETNEPFNYNLKRLGLRRALEENELAIMMDTDMFIKTGFNLLDFHGLEEGIYVRWKGLVTNKTKLSSDIEYDYIERVREKSGIRDLYFIDESTIIFKIIDQNKKKKIVDYWDDFYTETESLQPIYRNKGAVEGIIIYACASLLELNLYEDKQKFQFLIHYNKHESIDVKRKLI